MTESPADITPEQLEAQRWKPRDLPGHIGQIGPMWTRKEPDGWAYGLLCDAKHLNPARVMHGGVTASLLDHAISAVAWEACGRKPCLTVQLDTHFVESGKIGEVLITKPHVVRATRSLIFITTEVTVDKRVLAMASGVFKILKSE